MSNLYLVTDGSAVPGFKSAFDSASAFVIIKDYDFNYYSSTLLTDHTNNYAEMHAIYSGTKYIIENMEDIDTYDKLVIVTDSDLCHKSLTVWMKGWLKKAKNEKLINSSGEEVKNQELIKSTYINILTLMLEIPVLVCHINSHQSKKQIPKMYEKMNVKIPEMTYDEFEMIFKANDMCDTLAKDALK